MIHLNDLFNTVQGEGTNAGRRALFVRMPFCNLSCSWCDTQFNSFKEWEESAFLEVLGSVHSDFAVITGGEPSMHKHTPRVIQLLADEGFEIAMETNGMFPVPDGIDFLTVSPKRDGGWKVNPQTFARADEFKYVVDEAFDFSILDRHEVRTGARYYLSPEFGAMKENVEKILRYTEANPLWRLSLQTHKLIGIP
jgi:organic radical activating enzyme